MWKIEQNDLDVLNRILAQINTKLPHDATRLTSLHKVDILQYLHRLLPIGENLATETFEDVNSNNGSINNTSNNNFMKNYQKYYLLIILII